MQPVESLAFFILTFWHKSHSFKKSVNRKTRHNDTSTSRNWYKSFSHILAVLAVFNQKPSHRKVPNQKYVIKIVVMSFSGSVLYYLAKARLISTYIPTCNKRVHLLSSTRNRQIKHKEQTVPIVAIISYHITISETDKTGAC